MKLFVKSCGYALNGLKAVIKEERNFKIEIVIAIGATALALLFHVTVVELSLIILSSVLVLSLEIVNTAIEDLTDFISPLQNPLIGKIKDTMASAVACVSLGALLVGCIILGKYIVVFCEHVWKY